MIAAKAIVLAALVITGSPWEKNEEKIQPEPESVAIVEEAEWSEPETFTITHYCNCRKCCGKWAGGPTASGVMPEEGRTVAVDKSVIPLGSEVLIGDAVYIAEDTGVKGRAIDVYVSSHSEAIELGRYKTEVCWR